MHTAAAEKSRFMMLVKTNNKFCKEQGSTIRINNYCIVKNLLLELPTSP